MRGTKHLFRTNSVKESFELKKKEFLTCPIEQIYPQDLVEKVLADAQFSSCNTKLKNKPKLSKKILPFIRTFNPAYQNLKKDSYETLAPYFRQQYPVQIYPNPLIVAYRKVRSLEDSLVRAQFPSL